MSASPSTGSPGFETGLRPSSATGLDGIPEVSVAVPDEDGHGHLAEMRVDPVSLFQRVHDECGDPELADLAALVVDALEQRDRVNPHLGEVAVAVFVRDRDRDLGDRVQPGG